MIDRYVEHLSDGFHLLTYSFKCFAVFLLSDFKTERANWWFAHY